MKPPSDLSSPAVFRSALGGVVWFLVPFFVQTGRGESDATNVEGEFIGSENTPNQTPAIAKDVPSVAERIASWISPTARRMEKEEDVLRSKLAAAPVPVLVQSTLRLGFHSQTLFEQDTPDSLVVDLGRSYPLDLVSMVPVKLKTPLYDGQDYGFPIRFLIEASGSKDFSDPVVVTDQTARDFPEPQGLPVTFEADGVKARYLRITSTKHFAIHEHFIWALGEVCVISANRNVAADARVIINRCTRIPPAWAPRNLVDSQHIAALPLFAEASPSNGWRAEQESKADTVKWVEVDIGTPAPIDEIRLIPAHPTDMADMPGMGFPVIYRIEVRSDELEPWTVVEKVDQSSSYAVRDRMVVIEPGGIVASQVRITAEQLWIRQGRANFALAELQIISGNENLALGKPVTASDSFADPKFPRWAPEFLVDGFSSQHRLVDWSEYFLGIENYRRLTRELDGLESRYAALVSRIAKRVTVGGGALLLVLIAVPIMLLVRSSRRRKEEAVRLREQIARDLHDDIGSNLGGISLLSEADEHRDNLPEDVREDLAEIHSIATASSEAMRDIIWLIQDGDYPLPDLILRLKEIAYRMHGAPEISFDVRTAKLPDLRVSLRSRRHLLLAFKETLHNITRHAKAEKVAIAISVDAKARTFRFRVEDDGCGFDQDFESVGNGLNNLRRRAERLGGTCEISSSPDRGTTVTFTAPIRSR